MKNLRILLAEDDPLTAMSIVSCLEAEGYEVEAVPNGKEALYELEKDPHRFHVLITDMDMPVLTGADLIRKLRIFKFPVDVVVLTGSLNNRLKMELTSLGIKNIFSKPVDFDEVLNYLEGFKAINRPILEEKARSL